MHEICHELIAIYNLPIHQILSGWLAKLPAILDSFTGIANITSTPIGWEGGEWGGSYNVASKGYINIANNQMVFIGAIFTSIYHTKQLNPWPNSLSSSVVNYTQFSACQGDLEPFEDHPSTRGYLTSLRNKPQLKLSGQLSAPILG